MDPPARSPGIAHSLGVLRHYTQDPARAGGAELKRNTLFLFKIFPEENWGKIANFSGGKKKRPLLTGALGDMSPSAVTSMQRLG